MAGINPVGTEAIGTDDTIDVFTVNPVSSPVNPPSQNRVKIARFGVRETFGKTESIFTQKEKTFKYTGKRWEGEFELVSLNHNEVHEWKAWLASLEGVKHDYNLEPPYESPRGSVSQNGTVKSVTRPQTAIVQGLSGDQNNIFKHGDYIEFEETGELKMITNNTDSNSSGEATVQFQPPMRKKPSSSSIVNTQSPQGLFQLKNNEIGWQTNPNFTDLSFEFVEVVKRGS